MLRVATYNVENLFRRPAILNFDDNKKASPLLTKLAQLDATIAKDPYTAADKARILKLLGELKDYVDVNELRGRLLSSNKKTVTASGRSDWMGGIRLKPAELPPAAQENTAKVIDAVNADVLCVVEVENRDALENFAEVFKGAKAYPYNLVVDGNDQRGIDVGILSRFPLLDIRTHIFDRSPQGERIFSRDCLEVKVELPSGQPLALLVNHLKSQGYGSKASNDARRKLQADAIASILTTRYNLANDLVVVAGDLNDKPGSAPLANLIGTANLTEVVGTVANPADRWTYAYKNQKSQLDYLLVSKPLADNLAAVGFERRGMLNAKKLTGGAVLPFPTVTDDTNDASDHSALFADFNV